MSAPATALTQNTQRNVQIVTDSNHDAFAAILRDTIAKRAYEIFEHAGRPAGEDQAHWLRAESEVLQHRSPVRESGSWSTANATLPGSEAADLQVLLQSDRAIISCCKPSQSYVIFRFPVSVDPQTAAAYMKGDTFVLTAKHSSSNAASTPLNESRSVIVPATPTTASLNQKPGTKPKNG